MKLALAAPTDVRSHVGDGWFDRHDASVGTADERNSYLFRRRVALQLKIAQEWPNGDGYSGPTIDRIIDVRCYTANDETGELGCRSLSALAANALVGKTAVQAAAMRDEAFVAAEKVPWQPGCNGLPFLFADAVRAALLDWATKANGRRDRLPYEQAPAAMPPDPSVLTPFGRFLRALGL